MESILNQFTSEHVGLLTIVSLIFTILSTILAVYGIYLAKGQPTNTNITIHSDQTIVLHPQPLKKSIVDSIFDDNNFWLLVIGFALLGGLVKGQYSLIALLFSTLCFLVCVIIVIVLLWKSRPSENLLKKYLPFFITFVFSAGSIWSFAFPLFDSLPATSDISSLAYKFIYYVFSGTGYGLCIVCIIGSTASFFKYLRRHNQTRHDMRFWLFLSLLGGFLQSGVLTALTYHVLDFK